MDQVKFNKVNHTKNDSQILESSKQSVERKLQTLALGHPTS